MQKEDRISILALFIALAASMLGNIYLAAQLDMQQEQSAEKRCVERGGELLGGKYCVKPGSVLDK